MDAYGNVDAKRVGAVCEYAKENLSREASLKVLRLVKKALALKIGRDEALIESAGALDETSQAALEAFVKSKNPSAKIEFAKNSELLAGVRVKLGDNVWENSAKQKLEQLSQMLGA